MSATANAGPGGRVGPAGLAVRSSPGAALRCDSIDDAPDFFLELVSRRPIDIELGADGVADRPLGLAMRRVVTQQVRLPLSAERFDPLEVMRTHRQNQVA